MPAGLSSASILAKADAWILAHSTNVSNNSESQPAKTVIWMPTQSEQILFVILAPKVLAVSISLRPSVCSFLQKLHFVGNEGIFRVLNQFTILPISQPPIFLMLK